MSTTLEYTGALVKALADGSHEFGDWERAGIEISRADRHSQEWIGDWLNAGEERFGHKCYDTAEKLFPQYRRKSLQNIASVMKAVPVSLRREALCFSHYALVAKLADPRKSELVERAAAENLTVNALRDLINPPTPEPKEQEQPVAEKLLTPDVWNLLARHAASRGLPTLEFARQICGRAVQAWLNENGSGFEETAEEVAA